MMQRIDVWMGTLGLVAATAASAFAGSAIGTDRVASGLARPAFATHAPGDFGRLFIVEKAGVIRILDLASETVLATPFLDIDALVGGGTSNNSEQGLLGLAFHPDYNSNGYFYVYYTDNAGDTTLRRYTRSGDPDVADPNSAFALLTIAQPQSNHNGGWIDFGSNGYLHIASGDGGGGGDDDPGHTPGTGNAQDITNNLLGKILRIDVDGDDFPGDAARNYAIPPDNPFVGEAGDDEIWAYGLRNPWRCSFDRMTHDLWIADVGQGAWEEINFQPAASPGGENYGWRCREGAHDYDFDPFCEDLDLVEPIHEYGHSCAGGGFAIISGYVYRGCAIPDLEGTYFFADFSCGNMWSLRYDGATVSELTSRNADLGGSIDGHTVNQISSFGEDAYGEIYIVDQGSGTDGQIFRIVSTGGGGAPDCNTNGIADACETLSGAADDDNDNSVPDVCEPCRHVDGFVGCLTGPDGGVQVYCDCADYDADNDVDLADALDWQRLYPTY